MGKSMDEENCAGLRGEDWVRVPGPPVVGRAIPLAPATTGPVIRRRSPEEVTAKLFTELNALRTTLLAAVTIIADHAEQPHTMAEALRELLDMA